MEILQFIGVGIMIWLVAGFLVGLIIISKSDFEKSMRSNWDKSELSDNAEYPNNPKCFVLVAITLFGFISLFSFLGVWINKMKEK